MTTAAAIPGDTGLVYGSPAFFARVRVILGPNLVHRHIGGVDSRYRRFAIVAHLRADHGMTEIVPERAQACHDLLTSAEIAIASAPR